METFRSAEVTFSRNIILTTKEKRKPDSHEVLIKVKASAICGSDLHIYYGKHPYTKLPTTIGHEISGTVEAIGDSVTNISVGDRVVVEPLITCGTCYYCKRGRYDYCEHLRLKYRSGFSGYADYYYCEDRWIHKLPSSISFEEGALLEPFACTVHATMKANIQLCDSVCILGDGPIALMLTQLAVISGATKVFVLGLVKENLELAARFGAIPMRSDESSIPEIMKLTEQRGVDVVFEAVGVPETFNLSMKIVKRGGKAIIFGIFEDEFTSKALVDAMVREVNIIGTSSYCWDFQRGIELILSKKVNLKPLITHRFTLANVKNALEFKRTSKEPSLKIILEP